jgi:hypothetical protein
MMLVIFPNESVVPLRGRGRRPLGQAVRQAARRRTSQTVAARSSGDRARSQPPSIHWKGQYRLPGW